MPRRLWNTAAVPTWITPRRLGGAALLYAVFVGGWYLGQPLPYVGCSVAAPPPAHDASVVAEPGDVSVHVGRSVDRLEAVVTTDFLSTEAVVPCEPWAGRPRLVAWLIGDWR
ncbi:hypothetical protein GCM10010280_28310 [Streptomyces pilosus]|uniref:Uncharacterized protein n=1 Tax=Streptomyces pilosus TaxID=28893 RepID=A0A918BNX6_9ACTN|nr:hypothetical protein GCM10010280_28310 [Streptomyces pilosus]